MGGQRRVEEEKKEASDVTCWGRVLSSVHSVRPGAGSPPQTYVQRQPLPSLPGVFIFWSQIQQSSPNPPQSLLLHPEMNVLGVKDVFTSRSRETSQTPEGTSFGGATAQLHHTNPPTQPQDLEQLPSLPTQKYRTICSLPPAAMHKSESTCYGLNYAPLRFVC